MSSNIKSQITSNKSLIFITSLIVMLLITGILLQTRYGANADQVGTVVSGGAGTDHLMNINSDQMMTINETISNSTYSFRFASNTSINVKLLLFQSGQTINLLDEKTNSKSLWIENHGNLTIALMNPTNYTVSFQYELKYYNPGEINKVANFTRGLYAEILAIIIIVLFLIWKIVIERFVS